jgi:formylglycine-generating enzyme required for sulfatase activity
MSRLPDSYTRHPRTILWLVREGGCTIGDDNGDRAPAFGVQVGSFYLGKRPITNRQYEAFAPDHPRADSSSGDDDPVVGVGFRDAANGNGCTTGLDSLKPNPFGLQGMLGGVWEWTASLHLPYPAQDGDGRNDPAAEGPRVLRGGSYRVTRADLGSAVRRGADPDTHADDVGFRIARTF